MLLSAGSLGDLSTYEGEMSKRLSFSLDLVRETTYCPRPIPRLAFTLPSITI